MAKVRLLNGKPLMIGSKVALSDACCCPTGLCSCCLSSSTDPVHITFHGLSTVCGACALSAHGGLIADISALNTIFTVPKIESSACNEYFSASVGTLSIGIYNDFSCSSLATTVDADLQIDIVCDNDGSGCKWFVEADLIFIGGGFDCALIAFFSNGISVGDTIVNQCPGASGSCATTGGFVTIA